MVKIRIIIDNTNLLAENSTKVDFFDMFIFNNVKLELEVILYQPNKVIFITFVKSMPIPKVPKGRGWADIYTYKV